MKKNILPETFQLKDLQTKHLFRIMRTTTFLLIIGTLSICAGNTYSQKMNVSINKTNAQLTEIINEIENQTNYLFIYNNEVDVTQKLSIVANNKPIDLFLKKLLEDTDISFIIEGSHILLSKNAQASLPQQRVNTITGSIQDLNGEPIIGANIVIKGSTVGTISDISGNFAIDVPQNGILKISFIGYLPQEIPVNNQTKITVTLLEDTKSIEEIVVVGFGTQKKVNLTGAVGTVSSKDLQNRPVQNVQQALQGLIPGLNIQQTNGMLDATPSMNIRGTSNLGTGSSSSPLVLIDGVESDISNLNPQDIENISVLKDAAAASIYGSRAPFGVILVTTKKGSSGKTKVNYNNNFRWNAPVVLPKTMDSYSAATYLNDACINSNISAYITDEQLQRIVDYQNGTLTTALIPDKSNPTIWGSGYSHGNANVDIYDFYYKDWAFSQEHNLNVSGGNERFTFYTSLGYLDQSGLLEIAKDDFKKFTPMAKIEANVTDWLKLSYTTRFIRTDYSYPTELTNNLFSDLGRQGPPWVPQLDPNGHFYLSSQRPNQMVNGGRTNNQLDNFNNRASLVLEPIKNWKTTVEFNYNISSSNSHAVQLKTYDYTVANEPYIRRTTDYVSNTYWKNNFLNLNAYSSYHFSLNDNHKFTAMIGTQLEELKRVTFGLNRVGVIVDELPVVNLTTGLNYNGTAATPYVYGANGEWSTVGYFGRINYDYQGRYLLEANLRYDGTSRFRKDKRWNWFPSFSAGWNIAREKFWEDFEDSVNTLKLRASYGKLGNQNTDSWYPTYQVMSVYTNSGSWLQNGAKPNTAYSPDLISSSLTWERINTWDVGLDIAAFNNRLTGSFDYYQRKTLDMVGPAQELPNILGKAVPKTNNSDLKTSGFEIELAWQDQLKNGLSYRVRFLLSDYQTEITRYPNKTKSLSTYYEGQKLGNIWGYETIGIAKTNEEMEAHLNSLPNGGQNAFGSNWQEGDIMYKDLNGDGKISSGANTFDDPGDRKIIGNSTPRFQFGLDLNAAWKGFDARLFFQGVGKRDYWSDTDMFWGLSSRGQWFAFYLKEHLDYFRPEQSNDLAANLDAYYPRPLVSGASKNQQVQSRYLQNAAYIRLKNISLGYTLPQQFTNRFSVSQLRFFVSGENLWTGTKLAKMFDPESINTTYTSGDGYPIQKTISLGLTITL